MEDKLLRKKLRRNMGSYGWALLIYYILMTLCVTATIAVQTAIQMIQSTASGSVGTVDEAALMGNGWGYLIACVLAVVLLRLWKGKAFFHNLWKTEKTMTFGDFLRLLCLSLSAQFVFQIVATITELLLNMLGLSALEALEQATGGAETFSMFLYFSLGAPVVEEIIFRGGVLRGLEKYGKGFAVLFSALLFGVFHGNLLQSPYAFLVGLVLGYVTVEYNVLWAMVLHMVNNLILGDTLPRIFSLFGQFAADLAVQLLIIASFVATIVILIRRHREVADFFRANRIQGICVRAFFTAAGNIVLLLLMLVNAISMLFL